ncbi:YozD family protein [Bacillus sp. FSL K6-3431]|uniref:YozD family protein n=1 Tax=Bacillus sp. FSL K6-3431 TaxID=2921500 RepID=UPI0030FCA5F6
MREMEVFIDTEEIAEFFYRELLQRGYTPSEEEADVLADIAFDYLIEKNIIDEDYED